MTPARDPSWIKARVPRLAGADGPTLSFPVVASRPEAEGSFGAATCESMSSARFLGKVPLHHSIGLSAGDCCVACAEHHVRETAAGRKGCDAWALDVRLSKCNLFAAGGGLRLKAASGRWQSGRRPSPARARSDA